MLGPLNQLHKETRNTISRQSYNSWPNRDSRRKSGMPVSAESRKNFLLAALPDLEWRRWQPLLEQVEMPLG
jgi:hypothetical protein